MAIAIDCRVLRGILDLFNVCSGHHRIVPNARIGMVTRQYRCECGFLRGHWLVDLVFDAACALRQLAA